MSIFPGRGDQIYAGGERTAPNTPRKEENRVAEGYKGKIKNSGAQVVKAPSQVKGKSGTGKVIRGNDLRNGKGGK